MAKLEGEFEVVSWDEDTYQKLEGERKLTKASVTQKFTGDLAGTGSVEWLMSYANDGKARFVGFQRIESTATGHTGSVVIESNGKFDGKKAAGTWSVLPGSGEGDLEGITGKGRFEAPMGGKPSYSLEARFK
jgi:uncharacterized protein DUF3224